jgi:uncharacterized protein (TIGR02246 family)
MRSISFAVVGLLAFCCTATVAAAAAGAADEQAIKARLQEFQDAWNKHDTSAMAAIFTEDGTLINPVGVWAHGRKEVTAVTGHEHSTIFRGSKYELGEVKIQSVTPDVAIADVEGKVVGVHTPDGMDAPDYVHHVVWVFVQKDGKWEAAAARPYQFGAKPPDGK